MASAGEEARGERSVGGRVLSAGNCGAWFGIATGGSVCPFNGPVDAIVSECGAGSVCRKCAPDSYGPFVCSGTAPAGTTCGLGTRECDAYGGASPTCVLTNLADLECHCDGFSTGEGRSLASDFALCPSACLPAPAACADGSPCHEDSQCPSGTCDVPTLCIGTYCGGPGEPEYPIGASCTSTSQCEGGLQCLLGTCQPPQDDYFPCTQNAQCESQICNFGLCLPGPISDGLPCSTNAACQSGYCIGVCTSLLPNGTPCTLSNQSQSGICNFAFCIADPLPNGSLCTTSAACDSGLCVSGVCVDTVCGNGGCDFFSETCGVSDEPGGPIACLADCGACPLNSQCSVNADCESGFCDLDYYPGSPHSSCRPCREADAGLCPRGETCNDDVDCAGNDVCLSDVCVPPPPPCSGSNRPDGCQCSVDADCNSNDCVDPPGSAPPVCVPDDCSVLPGGLCFSNGACCDFPTVSMTCVGGMPISPGICEPG